MAISHMGAADCHLSSNLLTPRSTTIQAGDTPCLAFVNTIYKYVVYCKVNLRGFVPQIIIQPRLRTMILHCSADGSSHIPHVHHISSHLKVYRQQYRMQRCKSIRQIQLYVPNTYGVMLWHCCLKTTRVQRVGAVSTYLPPALSSIYPSSLKTSQVMKRLLSPPRRESPSATSSPLDNPGGNPDGTSLRYRF